MSDIRKNIFKAIANENKSIFYMDMTDYSINPERVKTYLNFYKDDDTKTLIRTLLNNVKYVTLQEMKDQILVIIEAAHIKKSETDVFIIYDNVFDSIGGYKKSNFFFSLFVALHLDFDDVACNFDDLKHFSSVKYKGKNIIVVYCDDATYSGRQSYLSLEKVKKETNLDCFLVIIPYHLNNSVVHNFLRGNPVTFQGSKNSRPKLKNYLSETIDGNNDENAYKKYYKIVNEVSVVRNKTVSDCVGEYIEGSISNAFQPMYLQTRMPDRMSVSSLLLGSIILKCPNLNTEYINGMKHFMVLQDENQYNTIFKEMNRMFYPLINNCYEPKYNDELSNTCPTPFHHTIEYKFEGIKIELSIKDIFYNEIYAKYAKHELAEEQIKELLTEEHYYEFKKLTNNRMNTYEGKAGGRKATVRKATGRKATGSKTVK